MYMKNRLLGIYILLNCCMTLFSMTPEQKKVETEKNNPCQQIMLIDRNTFPVYRPGISPLMLAAQQDKVKRMHELLASGYLVNYCNRQGVSALTLAIAYGNTRAVELLLKSGAYLYHRHKNGELAFCDLLRSNTPHTLRSFFELYSELQCTLWDAIRNDDTQCALRVLSQHPWLAHTFFPRKKTPLMLAAAKNNVVLIAHLLQLNVSLHAQDSKKQTALIHANKNNAQNAKIIIAGYFIYKNILDKDLNNIPLSIMLIKKVPQCVYLQFGGRTLLAIALLHNNFSLAYAIVNAGGSLSRDTYFYLRKRAKECSLDRLTGFLRDHFSFYN